MDGDIWDFRVWYWDIWDLKFRIWIFQSKIIFLLKIFKEKLEKLLKGLEDAKSKVDPVDAAQILQKYFGSDFPVPPKSTIGKKSVAAAVIPSSESASV